MPAKTKKEKLLAQYHRQTGMSSLRPISHHNENLSFVRRDVTKTLIFGFIAVAIEFVLYWNQNFLLL